MELYLKRKLFNGSVGATKEHIKASFHKKKITHIKIHTSEYRISYPRDNRLISPKSPN